MQKTCSRAGIDFDEGRHLQMHVLHFPLFSGKQTRCKICGQVIETLYSDFFFAQYHRNLIYWALYLPPLPPVHVKSETQHTVVSVELFSGAHKKITQTPLTPQNLMTPRTKQTQQCVDAHRRSLLSYMRPSTQTWFRSQRLCAYVRDHLIGRACM